jgi:ribosomal protein S10
MTNLFIKSLNINVLKIYVFYLKKIFNFLNLKYSILQLPLKKSRITLIKSPHINKKSREQFEIKSHALTFKLVCNLDISIVRFILLNKPSTVQIKIKYK